MSDKSKKLCFVVTPIGDKDTSIRRHIEGIIDHAIIPALEAKYEVEVAHRKYEIGSINDRIINSIFEADLVIANLTTLNPNVMFELAIRYSFGKPAIVIAEQGTKLPFDIVDENTIFYDNDPTGAFILKDQLIRFESNIVFGDKKYGPVHKALGTVALYKDIESGKEVSNEKMLRYILDKLDDLEMEQKYNSKRTEKVVDNKRYIGIEFTPMAKKNNYENKLESFQMRHSNIISEIKIINGRIRIIFIVGMCKEDIDFILHDCLVNMDITGYTGSQYLSDIH